MEYVSTRGGGPADFRTACLAGLAPDGGLFTPASYPKIACPDAKSSYTSIATDVLSAFAAPSLDLATVRQLVEAAYAGFAHGQVAPLVQLGPDRWMMELHHGPTLAFKDVAMQVIAKTYDHFLRQTGDRLTVLCATSGDTGGAAAAAFAGADNVDLFILHPHDRISPVQRRFMTSTGADNVHNFAVRGNFDDTQSIVKALFADTGFRSKARLSGVNSINWTRVAAQSVYFAAAQASLGRDRPLRFVVPTGNFGDALAGYVAARCGLLAGFECIAAVNENQTMVDLMGAGHLAQRPAKATLSPAMDIQVPSNFERLLFETSGRDGVAVRSFYDRFKQAGEADVPPMARSALSCVGVRADAVNDTATADEMRRVYSETGWLICPHTAVASAASRRHSGDATDVILATAHPAKFPETVEKVTGAYPELPARTQTAFQTPESFELMPAELGAIRAAIEDRIPSG